MQALGLRRVLLDAASRGRMPIFTFYCTVPPFRCSATECIRPTGRTTRRPALGRSHPCTPSLSALGKAAHRYLESGTVHVLFDTGGLMNRTKNYLYRAAVVRYIDSLFYETGNARRSHIRIYHSIVYRLLGIGKDAFRKYLRCSDTLLAGYELPAEMKYLLQFYVNLYKSLPSAERIRYLEELVRAPVATMETAPHGSSHPNAGREWAG